MKNILYIGKYNGIIGGIERYMQKSAGLLRANGFEVHYLHIEKGGKDQEQILTMEREDTPAGFSVNYNFVLLCI